MNNGNIEKFYFDFVKNNGRMPTNEETSVQLNLELEDIDAFQNSLIEDFDSKVQSFAVFSEKILIQLTHKAMKGNVPAIREWLKMVHKIEEQKQQQTEVVITKVSFSDAEKE